MPQQVIILLASLCEIIKVCGKWGRIVIKGIEELTDNYKEFKSMRCPILPPAEPVTLLPPLVQDTDPGMSIQETF